MKNLFNIGEKVTVREDLTLGKIYTMVNDTEVKNMATELMLKLRGKQVTIVKILSNGEYILSIKDDPFQFSWTDNMFEESINKNYQEEKQDQDEEFSLELQNILNELRDLTNDYEPLFNNILEEAFQVGDKVKITKSLNNDFEDLIGTKATIKEIVFLPARDFEEFGYILDIEGCENLLWSAEQFEKITIEKENKFSKLEKLEEGLIIKFRDDLKVGECYDTTRYTSCMAKPGSILKVKEILVAEEERVYFEVYNSEFLYADSLIDFDFDIEEFLNEKLSPIETSSLLDLLS